MARPPRVEGISIVMTVDRDRIPTELVGAPRWLVWSYERRNGDKPTKVPFQAKYPARPASSTDPATWTTFDVAMDAVDDGKADGPGLALGDGLVGVDIDNCHDPATGAIDEEAWTIISALDSYAEVSPSGRGVHVLVKGKLPEGGRKKGPIEMYASGRYFTITGQHLEGTPTTIEERTEALSAVHARVFGPNPGSKNAATRRPAVSALDFDDDALLELARQASNGRKFDLLWNGDTSGYPSESEADLALCNLLAFWTGRNTDRMDRLFRQSGLMRPKWNERRGQHTYGAATIATAIASCLDTYTPPVERHAGADGERLEEIPHPAADANSTRAEPSNVTITDFHAYLPAHTYIFVPTREQWPAAAVDGRLPRVEVVDGVGKPVLDEHGKPKTLKPSAWLDRNRPIEMMTWAPGCPMFVTDRLVADGGWFDHVGVTTFNLYRPPTIETGDSSKAQRWIDHVTMVYPTDADFLFDWFAHRVQAPHVKPPGVVLVGEPGIGKDSALDPVRHAVGPWNVADVTPVQVLGRFNGFAKSVILRISEGRDLGDVDRYAFYEHLKVYTAAPPEVLRVDEKNVREHAVFNVTGVVLTTNHLDGLYLPANDRRFYVARSDKTKDDFDPSYWSALYAWYEAGGRAHVAAWLRARSLSRFNPKAPPPKTTAFWAVVNASRAPEDAEIADRLEALKHPVVLTVADLISNAPCALNEWLKDRKNGRAIPHRLREAGYVEVQNPDAPSDGRWRIGTRKHTVYGRRELSTAEHIAAIRDLGVSEP